MLPRFRLLRQQDSLDLLEGGYAGEGRLVAGVDEAGRGPLAGPVVAAAVVLPECVVLEGVADSKQLAPGERGVLAVQITARALGVGLGAASVREIEQVNILRATARAMCRAVANLGFRPDHLLVDGLPMPELGAGDHTAVIGGDRRVRCISCASIVAKVWRDRLMVRLSARYPGYGWERNKGYATPEHFDALGRLGPSPHHRRTFTPVRQLALDDETA
ncbi:MAG: ribonuclease HII [Longimicrobiaceae bacterium]